ncbi:YHYH protein [Rhodalgimonas zhirmunskyi]|uniref:YHYH protein n=1 Tax=Rhodalgimonas zhirmunskyi TaxID=2964767 RepID=A0AAJ1X5Z6_9RHOB|nr:YHYH protein [Rhodoalgimonas zhirmunskyi]MDQ2095001.1 YHYH protein [Rhodoalgimonas zhirmunskyi]
MFIRPFLTTALLALGAALPAAAHDDRLHEIEAFFADADIVSGPTQVDCTLSGGTKTSCFSITVKPNPKAYTPGPWCPQTITDGADKGGIWFLDGGVADVDGDFITRLAKIYGDTEWQLFDPETGQVRFTGTLEACEAAARPDVDPAYQNYCVQCLPEYLPEDTAMTYVIPLEPIKADAPSPTHFAGSGLAYNGIRLDGPAPVDAILGAHTIAPFDDCGGHVNTHVGYHYHAVTTCLQDAPATTVNAATYGPQIGIAMDGHPIMAHKDGIEDQLDACNGMEVDGLGYLYFAGAAGDNAILGCHVAEVGCTLEGKDATCDASQMGRRGPPPGGGQPGQAGPGQPRPEN